MSETAHLPPVSPDEHLARFITVNRWLRADKSIRPDAFMPPKDLNLSVTRHLGLSEESLWKHGQNVADALPKERSTGLFGRADITSGEVTRLTLKVEAYPLPENANHAHINGWPDKPAKKNIAQRLAQAAKYEPKPQTG
jgi:hypothetical protein